MVINQPLSEQSSEFSEAAVHRNGQHSIDVQDEEELPSDRQPIEAIRFNYC